MLVWKMPAAENEAAKISNLVPFFVHRFRQQGGAPDMDLLGGKSWLGSELGAALQPASSAGTLAQLGQALRDAATTFRFFRSFQQW